VKKQTQLSHKEETLRNMY